MDTIITNEIVKVMERGQITIPVKIRQMLGIHKGSAMRIKVTNTSQVFLQPVQSQQQSQFQSFLKQALNTKKTFWTDEDSKHLKKINAITDEKLQSRI